MKAIVYTEYGPPEVACLTEVPFLIHKVNKILMKVCASGDVTKFHTYAFTPDECKATAMPGNSPDAYNQVWYVPTTKEKFTYGLGQACGRRGGG